ncbi:MAG TPA: metal/formaldehyde-sensitive transcriptional repressor [Terriglobales bacterium]|nr:metal/formaldehyde-sensitive transcriptional repressor [Terriglobales bacterium]
MSHTVHNKQKLLARIRRVRGQVEALERSVAEEQDCSDILQLMSAARGAMNSLMTELLEGHIRTHVLDPRRRPTSEQSNAAEEVIDMVKTYLR